MNVSLLLDLAVEAFPERPVLGFREGAATVSDLFAASLSGAAAVEDAQADAVVFLGENGPAFTMAIFAAARAGVPIIPLNYRLATDRVTQLLANHPRALVVCDPNWSEMLVGTAPAVMSIDAWMEACAAGRNPGKSAAVDPDSPAAVIYTSGTTSTPKGVLLRHRHLVSYVLASVELGSAGDSDAAVISVPPYHIAGVANALTNLYAGRRTVVLERFDPRAWLNLVQQEHITNALVVPTMLVRILDETGPADDLPTLRVVAYGGAPMPVTAIERALMRWPHIDFVNAYGLTETSSTIALLGPADHRAAITSDDLDIRARLRSVGRVLPDVDIRIVGTDARDAPRGVPGRILVRGPQVSAEYSGQGSVLDDEGYFDTRDEGYLDLGGYLFVLGRADDVIIRGGENIAPSEIEDVLFCHPAVTDAVVVGVPDDVWGQRLEAAVVLTSVESADTEQLREFVRTRLRGSKTPDRIVIWDALPRTETGKIIRRTALERLLDDGPSRIP